MEAAVHDHYRAARNHLEGASASGPTAGTEALAFAHVEALLYIGEQLEVLAGLIGERPPAAQVSFT